MRRVTIPRSICGLALMAVVALVGGCGSSSSSSTSSSGASASASSTPVASTGKVCLGGKKVGFVDIYASSPAEHKMDQLAMQAASDLGWQLHFVDAQSNFTTYEQAMTSFVTEHDNLIIATSSDSAPIRQGLQAAKAAGIPVIEVGGGDQDPDHLFTARYNENETEMGQLLGAYIVKTVPSAKIGDLATTLNYSGAAREAGLRSAVAASGGSAKVVAFQQVDLSNPAVNTSKTLTDMLTAHPEINAVFAVFDPMAAPAASVIRQRGSKAKLYSNFATPSNLQLIKNGELSAVVDDNLPLTVAVALDQYINHIKSGAAFDPNAVAKAGGLQYRIVTTPNATYSNAATLAPFLAKWKKEC